MSSKSAPFYWLTCDGPDCKSTCPSQEDEVAAWSDADQAQLYADDSDWMTTVDGKDYCRDCSPRVCNDCAAWNDVEHPGEQDYLCTPCWQKSEVPA